MMLARYQLVRMLGEGGFGEVQLALDRAMDNKRVAIKFLHRVDSDSLERLRREVRILRQQVDNVHVVDVLDYDLETHPPYVVLEYCEGGSLRKDVGRLDWSDTAWVLAQAVNGLHGLHRVGGFHRDMKPDNLLIAHRPDGSQIVKVADFGLARTPVTENFPMTRHGAGTPGYIAPEILRGAPYAATADIYSLGVVGIELLTGTRDISQVTRATAPPQFIALLMQMTSLQPDARPSTAALARGLHALLEPASVQTSPRPVIDAARTPSSGAGAAVAAFAGLAALLGLAALAGGNSKEWDSRVGRYRDRDGRFTS
jgi:serine/threonine protein kinase